ncbi:MAG: aromatic amino acid transaminase [Gammaproteobacteria bacterium]
MFESLDKLQPDPILGLIGAYNKDPRPEKVDLGAGVYRTEQGETPVMAAVKDAEKILFETQASKTYTGSEGEARFNELMQAQIFGADHPCIRDNRVWTIQTPGGSGALRIAAWLLLRAEKSKTVWVSDPTWANHIPLLGSAGLELKTYPYYDATTGGIRFDEMLAALEQVPSGDTVLLHAFCHNPTGADLSAEQWHAVADVLERRKLLPFLDMAYQGFAGKLEEDVVVLRALAERFDEMIVASSCSKNFGMYRDRVGALSVVTKTAAASQASWSQAVNIVRRVYSVPPNHGAAVVATILGDATLRPKWVSELDAMRERMIGNRQALADALAAGPADRDFSHLPRGNGMFALLGLTQDEVLRIRDQYGVYMVGSSRINIAGVSQSNLEYLAAAVASVCTAA